MENIYICRAPRNGQHPYMQLLRKLPQDKELTLEERGLLIYILSLPSNFMGDITTFGKCNGIGRNKIFRIIKRLEEVGYCTIQKDGLFKKATYVFHEEKMVKIAPTPSNEPTPETEYTAENECERVLGFDTPKSIHQSEYTEPGKKEPEKSPVHISTLDSDIKRKEEEHAAKAANSSRCSEEAFKLEQEIINLMKAQNIPGWNAPNSHFLAHQCDILLSGGATYQQIVNAVLWALESDWWGPKLFSSRTNPGTVIRKNFPEWFKSMKTPKKYGSDRRVRVDGIAVDNEHKHLF